MGNISFVGILMGNHFLTQPIKGDPSDFGITFFFALIKFETFIHVPDGYK